MALCCAVKKRVSQRTRKHGRDIQGPRGEVLGTTSFSSRQANTVLLVKAIMVVAEALFTLFPRDEAIVYIIPWKQSHCLHYSLLQESCEDASMVPLLSQNHLLCWRLYMLLQAEYFRACGLPRQRAFGVPK